MAGTRQSCPLLVSNDVLRDWCVFRLWAWGCYPCILCRLVVSTEVQLYRTPDRGVAAALAAVLSGQAMQNLRVSLGMSKQQSSGLTWVQLQPLLLYTPSNCAGLCQCHCIRSTRDLWPCCKLPARS